MLQQLSPPLCCSPPATAVIMVSPPPQFAGGDSPPKHFIWPEPMQVRPKGHVHHRGPVNNSVLLNFNNNNKRKSAVELLQESKAYYVKSEHVLDKKQVLRNVGHLRPAAGPPPRPRTHHRTVSLDKVALLSSSSENTPPPRVPERSCSQSPPPLPPKSPRVLIAGGGRPRAKTMVLPPVARRQGNSSDVQMRLRQLLSHSSMDREAIGSGYRRLSDEDARRLEDDDHIWLNEEDSSAFDSKTVACEKIYPSSRHSTPTAASRSLLSPVTHKSLPDLSPNTKHGDESSSSASSSNRCYYPSSRATSDYVSRSPSSCKCCGSRVRTPSEAACSPKEAKKEEEEEEDELLSPDDDSGRRRPVLRSKSDISHRYSRPAFLAPVPRTELEEAPPAALKTSEEVQNFFEHLGLEEDAFKILTRRGSHDSPVFFGSVSSVESWPGTQYAANASDAAPEETPLGPGGTKMGEQPSIVERNARIIKWLCNCRKAQSSTLS